ncbi:MAG: hypothetical protein ACXABU_10490 [Candidatus Hodarchaeales archaeon]|jgi:hypothetical protein
MASQSTYNSSQLFNDVSLEILFDLYHAKKALTIYAFDKKYSYRQYQYMLKKLESNLIIKPYKEGKKKFYKLNHFNNELVRSVLEIKKWEETNDHNEFPQSLSDDKRFFRVLSALKETHGWAFTDTTALLIWAPFLDLQLPYFTVCVRDRYLKSKLEESFPRSVLRVQLQAKFFSQESNITDIKGVPVLNPEILVPRLLCDENTRVRLSSLFLLPFLSPRRVLKYQKKNTKIFPSILYFLFALENVLNRDSTLSTFSRQWFYNFDHFDMNLLFSHYLQQMGKKRTSKLKPTTFKRYELLRIKQQLQSNQWTEWDRLGMLFPDKTVNFEPSDLLELIISSSPLLAEA